jgi:membrane protein implicated in regulation of membrane protease activity
MVMWGALVALLAALAVVLLDPILAAFVVILLVTAAVSALVARDWDRHSTYEERELARAQKRAEKWERGKDARARDRAKWEAHQVRQAGRAEQ